MTSYYLLPKGNIELSNCFKIEYLETGITPNILSPSLNHYLLELQQNPRLNNPVFYKLQNDIYPYFNKIIKTTNYCSEFFEILEIIQTMHLNKYIETNIKTPLQIVSFEKNIHQNASSLAFQYIRTNNNNNNNNIFQKDIFSFWNNEKYNIYSFEKIYLSFAAKNHIVIANNTKCIDNKSILIQMCMALCIQCKKGIFIWKIGDCYSQLSLEILFFLSSFYERIYIMKPSFMDISKSEKYIVCKGFLYENSYSIYTYLHRFIKYIDTYTYNKQNQKQNIYRFLNINIPYFFVSKLEEINCILGQIQLEQINYLLLLLCHKYKDEKVQNIIIQNEQKCIEWCRRNRFFVCFA